MQHSILGLLLLTIIIEAEKIKWIGREESQGGDKHWSWQRPYRIWPDDWGVSVKKKKSVVNKGMLLFIIKKVTAQITTKFVTIHQIASLSGPGITVFGGNQSTLPEINGRMRTFIINSYQSISKRSLTFREERTLSIPLCRKRSLKVIGVYSCVVAL